jgi:hypothetical protein
VATAADALSPASAVATSERTRVDHVGQTGWDPATGDRELDPIDRADDGGRSRLRSPRSGAVVSVEGPPSARTTGRWYDCDRHSETGRCGAGPRHPVTAKPLAGSER